MRRKLIKPVQSTVDNKTIKTGATAVPSKDATLKKHKKGDAERARLRRNQRNSRARRREYVKQLETRCRKLDAAKNGLRGLLRDYQIDDETINGVIKHAESAAADEHDIAADPDNCRISDHSPDSLDGSFETSPTGYLDTCTPPEIDLNYGRDDVWNLKRSNLGTLPWSSGGSLDVCEKEDFSALFYLPGLVDVYPSKISNGQPCTDTSRIYASNATWGLGTLSTSPRLQTSNLRTNQNLGCTDEFSLDSYSSSPVFSCESSPWMMANNLNQAIWNPQDLTFPSSENFVFGHSEQ